MIVQAQSQETVDKWKYDSFSLSGEQYSVYDTLPHFELMPEETVFAEDITEDLIQRKANIGAEFRLSIPLPPGLGKDKAFQLAIYNALHKIRSLKGATYFSSVTEEKATLFTSAYTLNDIENQKVIRDISFEDIPEQDKLYIVLRASDISGRALYSLNYEYKEDELLITMLNENIQLYVMFPVSTAKNNETKFLLRFLDDSIDIYMNNGIDNFVLTTGVVAPMGRVQGGFIHRLRTMFRWIRGHVEQEAQKRK